MPPDLRLRGDLAPSVPARPRAASRRAPPEASGPPRSRSGARRRYGSPGSPQNSPIRSARSKSGSIRTWSSSARGAWPRTTPERWEFARLVPNQRRGPVAAARVPRFDEGARNGGLGSPRTTHRLSSPQVGASSLPTVYRTRSVGSPPSIRSLFPKSQNRFICHHLPSPSPSKLPARCRVKYPPGRALASRLRGSRQSLALRHFTRNHNRPRPSPFDRRGTPRPSGRACGLVAWVTPRRSAISMAEPPACGHALS